MRFIDWKTIQTNFGAVTALLDLTLRCIVTLLTKGLHGTESKSIPVALVGLDVVDDGSWHDATTIV
jgi:hypothetical protein